MPKRKLLDKFLRYYGKPVSSHYKTGHHHVKVGTRKFLYSTGPSIYTGSIRTPKIVPARVYLRKVKHY